MWRSQSHVTWGAVVHSTELESQIRRVLSVTSVSHFKVSEFHSSLENEMPVSWSCYRCLLRLGCPPSGPPACPSGLLLVLEGKSLPISLRHKGYQSGLPPPQSAP